METVDIFRGIDGFEDALGIHLRRERELDEDAVDVVAPIQFFDEGDEIGSLHARRRRKLKTFQTELRARRDFALHVDVRCRIIASQNGGQARLDAVRDERGDLVFEFGVNLVANDVAVENAGGQRVPLADVTFCVAVSHLIMAARARSNGRGNCVVEYSLF